MENNHHHNVRMYLAIGSLIIAAGMIAGFYFIDIPENNVRLLDTALGFAAGFVTTSFGYYFTASHNQQTNQKDTNNDKPST